MTNIKYDILLQKDIGASIVKLIFYIILKKRKMESIVPTALAAITLNPDGGRHGWVASKNMKDPEISEVGIVKVCNYIR